jgi:uncharacterized repeat protein (TIGR03803 family)
MAAMLPVLFTAAGGAAVTPEVLWEFVDVFDVAASSPASLASLRYIYGGLVETSPGVFYGTGTYGGELGEPGYVERGFGYGGVFRLDVRGPAAIRTKVHQFTCGVDGRYPWFLMRNSSDGKLYGTTGGGCNNYGNIFRFDPATNSLTTVYGFDGTEGSSADELVDGGGGVLYGLASKGYGSIFAFNTVTNTLTTIHEFNNTDGAYPSGLLLANDGGLYGATTSGPGGTRDGALFRFDLSSATLATFYVFNQAVNQDGTEPRGKMVEASPGVIYGNTSHGGPSNQNGVIFRIDAPGGSPAVTSIVSLDGAEDNSWGRMLLAGDGYLYGTAFNYAGSVYRVNISGPTPVVEYLPMDLHGGFFANAGLVEGTDGKLYGTTTVGGVGVEPPNGRACGGFGGCGVAFRFSPPAGARSTPTNKEQCRDGGWRSFTNPSFASRGQCMSFVGGKGK